MIWLKRDVLLESIRFNIYYNTKWTKHYTAAKYKYARSTWQSNSVVTEETACKTSYLASALNPNSTQNHEPLDLSSG